MDLRLLARPLPLILVFLFVAVAVGDLVQKLGESPEPPPQVGGSTAPRFEVLEPVVDFRPRRTDPSVQIVPLPELDPGRWSEPGSRGVWALGATAGFDVDLAVGGHRVLVMDVLPAGGKRRVKRVRLELNGVDCGELELSKRWEKHIVELPDGAARPGSNRVALTFPDRQEATRTRKSLLIRKLGLFFRLESAVEGLSGARPIWVDAGFERVSFQRSGILTIPLTLDDRTDALQMRYRFLAGSGKAEMTVSQLSASAIASNDTLHASVDGAKREIGPIRFPLHGRLGEYVFQIRVTLDEPGARLLLRSLQLVEEGDPTRRPRTADQHPD
jgi:hypothetical protein